jgi:hypothetical protein
MRRLLLLGTLLLAAGTASAATNPVVPPAVQARIAAKAPRLAYVPTRMGFGFRLRRWEARSGIVRMWFRNRAGWEITFVAAPLRGSCRDGFEKSFQLAGNKVYWAQTTNEQQAWRCLRGPGGRTVRLVAASAQPPTKFADSGLGRIVASGRLIRR